MKILALNSSPRTQDQSKTELMLNALVEGMQKEGAEVEVISLRKKTVKNCIGCFSCWTKTPGVCIQKDDMTTELFPKWVNSDLAVYATPLYHWTMNATMKAFIERTLPVIQPFFVMNEGRWKHPLRDKHPRQAVLCVAAFPEDDVVFSQISSYFNFVYGKGLVAEIYRSSCEMMVSPTNKDKLDDILDATKQAGEELVKSMEISPETMARIKQPVGDFKQYAKIGNAVWKTCISEGLTIKEFNNRGMIPRPDSLETFMLILPMGLNSKALGDRKVILQFKFSGEVEDSCYFTIDKGNVETKSGTSESPDLTVDTPFEVWMDIMTGKADGQQMLLKQKYKVKGDMSLFMQLFSKEV